ncbi:tRNA(Ile)-lysidine synthetase [Escherichia coli]|uniref:tRNA(Ile)-lysidine synthetase n=1 Tax=Escherichia coli TaxID=562 RepID=A0A447X9Z9_ECOLX|nr:tRNA(Ile)-lysidine synthetase [Escherichia coli]
MLPPVYAWARLKSAAISRNCGGLNPSLGQSETIVPWQTWLQPLELPAGLGSVQLTAGGDIRPPRADEAVSVRFKAPGLLHIIGRNGGRKLKKIWQELGVPAVAT